VLASVRGRPLEALAPVLEANTERLFSRLGKAI
jgi:hypothetical protein